MLLVRPAIRGGGAIEQLTDFDPRNFHKRMYLLGAAISYILLTPLENISWLRPCFLCFGARRDSLSNL